MKKFLAVGVLALSTLSAAHAATVTGGDFDTIGQTATYTVGAGYMSDGLFNTNTSGYSNTPDGIGAGYIQSYGGTSGLFGTAPYTGSISFTLADLVVGQAYTVDFLSAASSLYTVANAITIAYNGTTIGTFSPTSTNWTSHTSSVFNATGTAGQLTFTGASVPTNGGTRSTGIDAVTIASASGTAAVPEPATWAMMIGGFGMVGGALRRRRVTLSLA